MTGLMYVVIIALWAAILIPIWLRRHDQVSEVRSTARFSSAMRTLADPPARHRLAESRSPAPGARSGRRAPGEVRPVRELDQRAEGMDLDYDRELMRQSAATRRAVVLGVLGFLLLACLILAVLSMAPRWLPVLAALPVVGFVAASVLTAPQRRANRPRSAGPSVRSYAEPLRPVPAPATAEGEWEDWDAWDDDSWEAVPTTLPTYVDAPRASAIPRGIERDGEWTGEAMVNTARTMRLRDRDDSGAPLAARPAASGAETTEIPIVQAEIARDRAANE